MNQLCLLLAESDWWTENFFGLEAGQRFVLLFFMVVFGAAIVMVTIRSVSSAIRSIHRNRTEADLKRDMLDRGMSAEEIECVIRASRDEPNQE